MKLNKLGEIAEFINGRAFKPSEWSKIGLPIVRIQNLNNAKALFNYFDGSYSERNVIDSGDVLLSWSGTPGTSFGCFLWERGKALLNQHIFKVVLDLSIVEKEYFVFCVNANLYQIIDNAHGGVGLQHITKKRLVELQIPLPPLLTQRKIAEVLDKADAIRKCSQKILAKYDQLAQSVFLEMFGNKKFKLLQGKDLLKIQGGAAFKSTDFQDRGIPVVRIGTVNKGFFDKSQIVYLPERFLKSNSRYILSPGDLLLTLTGTVGKEDYGNLFILGNDHPNYLLNQRVAKLDLDSDKITIQYFKFYLEQSHVKSKLTGVSRGVRQANINNGDVYKIEISVPPIDLQNQFATIISQIEKQKAQTQLELDRAEELYQSLLQRAFTGALFPEIPQKELTNA